MKTGFRGIVGGIYSLFTKPASKIGLGVLVTGAFLRELYFGAALITAWKKRMRKNSVFPAIR